MRRLTLFGVFALSVMSLSVTGSAAAAKDELLKQYFVIQKSLASDSTSGIAASAAEMKKISRQAAAAQPNHKAELLALSDAAGKMSAADVKAARNGFGPLSDRLIAYLKASGAPANPPYQYYCSMVKKNWLQPDKGVRNPYYGSSMLKCGELVQLGKTAGQPDQMNMGHHH